MKFTFYRLKFNRNKSYTTFKLTCFYSQKNLCTLLFLMNDHPKGAFEFFGDSGDFLQELFFHKNFIKPTFYEYFPVMSNQSSYFVALISQIKENLLSKIGNLNPFSNGGQSFLVLRLVLVAMTT